MKQIGQVLAGFIVLTAVLLGFEVLVDHFHPLFDIPAQLVRVLVFLSFLLGLLIVIGSGREMLRLMNQDQDELK